MCPTCRYRLAFVKLAIQGNIWGINSRALGKKRMQALTRKDRKIRLLITAAFFSYTALATLGFLGLSAVPLDPPYSGSQEPRVLVVLFCAMAVIPMAILRIVQKRTAQEEWPAADTDTVINVTSLLALFRGLKPPLVKPRPPKPPTGGSVVRAIATVAAMYALVRGLKKPPGSALSSNIVGSED